VLSTLAGLTWFTPPAYANVAIPTMSPPPTVSVAVHHGAPTLTITGPWTWSTLKNPTTAQPCDDRFGVGWAMAWYDPNDPGTVLSYQGGAVKVHVGSTGVNPKNTDNMVTYDHAHPCGTAFDPTTKTDTGTYTATHTYAGVQAVPTEICVVMYDLTIATSGSGPDPARLQLTNADNSVKDALMSGGSWDTTPGGPNCAGVRAPVALTSGARGATMFHAITDTARLSSTGRPTGSLTFSAYGPGDAGCAGPPVFATTVAVAGNGTYGPVSYTPPFQPTPAKFRWVASYSGDGTHDAASGTCGDPSEISVLRRDP
jgi:hypothetical protein